MAAREREEAEEAARVFAKEQAEAEEAAAAFAKEQAEAMRAHNASFEGRVLMADSRK